MLARNFGSRLRAVKKGLAQTGSAGVGVGKGGSFQARRSLSEAKAVMPIQMDLPFKTVHELQIRATEVRRA
jgi:hypothetical protein